MLSYKIKKIEVSPFLTNCYLVFSAGESLVIDPGAEAQEILKVIEKENAKLKYIVNTHYHPDHTFADKEIKDKTNAKIIIHEFEKEFIDFVPDIFVNEGSVIKLNKFSLKVLHTPGHSMGSICLFGDKVAFTGDTVFKDGIGRVDLPGGSELDLAKSIQKINNLFKKGMVVYPGHGEAFIVK
jgi:glyoxylase-like metal-dependent hydrolase (beta-lactamase superfamily II)